MGLELLNKIISFAFLVFSAAVLSFLIFNIFKKKIDKKISLISIVLAFVFSVAFAIFKSILQYFIWKGDGFAKYFLPPYNDISYFFQYSFFKFFAPSLAAMFFSALIFFSILLINKAYKRKQLFSEYDSYLFLIGGILVGWPNLLLYVGAVFIFALCYLVITSIENLNFQKNVELTYFWPALALAVLLLGNYFMEFFRLNLLII